MPHLSLSLLAIAFAVDERIDCDSSDPNSDRMGAASGIASLRSPKIGRAPARSRRPWLEVRDCYLVVLVVEWVAGGGAAVVVVAGWMAICWAMLWPFIWE
jgi:hypothetical protein